MNNDEMTAMMMMIIIVIILLLFLLLNLRVYLLLNVRLTYVRALCYYAQVLCDRYRTSKTRKFETRSYSVQPE